MFCLNTCAEINTRDKVPYIQYILIIESHLEVFLELLYTGKKLAIIIHMHYLALIQPYFSHTLVQRIPKRHSKYSIRE